jgi:hypothetical protein
MDKFCDQQRSGTVSHSKTETDQESRSNKHLDVNGSRLEDNANDHDAASSDNTSTTTSNIGNVRGDWESHNRTNGLDGVQQASGSRARIMECWEGYQQEFFLVVRFYCTHILSTEAAPEDRSSWNRRNHWSQM